MNNKEKGNITELKCLLALKENGIDVSIPYGDNSRYDFVIDVNNKLFKVQCKSSHLTKYNSYEFATCSNNWNNKRRKSYKNEIDFFITDVDGICCLIPINDVGDRTSFALRKEKSEFSNNPHYIENYKLENVISNL